MERAEWSGPEALNLGDQKDRTREIYYIRRSSGLLRSELSTEGSSVVSMCFWEATGL